MGFPLRHPAKGVDSRHSPSSFQRMMVFYKSCSGGNDFLQIECGGELKTPPTPQRIRDGAAGHQGVPGPTEWSCMTAPSTRFLSGFSTRTVWKPNFPGTEWPGLTALLAIWNCIR
jgi:hypothetical protein